MRVPDDVPASAVARTLTYMYTDRVPEDMAFDEARDTLIVANYYDVAGLSALCTRELELGMTAERAPEVLRLADRLCIASLRESALRFVAGRTLEVMETHAWDELISEGRADLANDVLRMMAGGSNKRPRESEGDAELSTQEW